MNVLAKYFSSEAKFRILDVLSSQTTPIPLRHISYLAELPVRSVELALKSLSTEKLVLKEKRARYVLFGLNRSHPAAETIIALFEFLRNRELVARSAQYHSRGEGALVFASETHELYRNQKR
jgi:hypothetical protein